MRDLLSYLLVLLLLGALSSSASGAVEGASPCEFFVSFDDCSDHFNGLTPARTTGGNGPFCTLSRAQTAVRLASGSCTVRVKPGGSYYQSDTLTFTAADSGLPGKPHVWTGAKYPTESRQTLTWAQNTGTPTSDEKMKTGTSVPRVSGGVPVQHWRKHSKIGRLTVWAAPIPKGLKGDMRQATALASCVRGSPRLLSPINHWGFVFESGQFKLWDDIAQVNVLVYHAWTSSRHGIKQVFEHNQTVLFTNPSQWPIGQWEHSAGNRRFFLENSKAFLDSPLEWVVDTAAAEVLIVLQSTEDPNLYAFTGSSLDTVVALRGSPSDPSEAVHDLVFSHLEFTDTNWECAFERGEKCDGQAAAFQTHGGVTLDGAESVIFHSCSWKNHGNYALWVRSASHSIEIQSSTVSNVGTGGVRIGGAQSFSDPYQRVDSVVVNNSVISAGGFVYPSGCGILLQQASKCVLTHNEIGHFSYTGVSVGWDWSYSPTQAHQNTIEFNLIHDIGRMELSDMGGIYTLGRTAGTALRNNVIYRVLAYNYGGWGIYPDQASSNLTVSFNIAHSCKSALYHQHFGENNLVENNVFADGAERIEPFPQPDGGLRTDPDAGQPNSFVFRKNIVLLTAGALFLGNFNESEKPVRKYVFGSNVYWHSQNSSKGFVFPSKDGSFEQWQASGHDVDSVVANPEFEDAARFDFRVAPGSPALARGFQQIDTTNVGPYHAETQLSVSF